MISRFSDHAANERTYLAWVRTAISLMAFGFLLERFDIFLFYASHLSVRSTAALHVRATEWIGLCLIIFGAAVILLATIRFYKNRRLIEIDDASGYGGSAIVRIMAGLLILMAVFLVVYVANQIVALS